MDITRKRGAPIVPPLAGTPLLIDPRREDPLAFLFLDVRETFDYLPALGLSPRDVVRAEYTITTLGLNRREFLRPARRGAFKHYLGLLHRYVDGKAAGAPAAEILNWENGIRRETGHPTVWAEIKRQRELLGAAVARLFDNAPEALAW